MHRKAKFHRKRWPKKIKMTFLLMKEWLYPQQNGQIHTSSQNNWNIWFDFWKVAIPNDNRNKKWKYQNKPMVINNQLPFYAKQEAIYWFSGIETNTNTIIRNHWEVPTNTCLAQRLKYRLDADLHDLSDRCISYNIMPKK